MEQVVKKVHLGPDLESFLLLNLWVAVADLYEKHEEERVDFSLGCARTRPRHLADS